MGKGYSCLLKAVGPIRSGAALPQSRNLAKAMSEANKKHRLVRFLPSEKLIMRWVEQAKALTSKISYR